MIKKDVLSFLEIFERLLCFLVSFVIRFFIVHRLLVQLLKVYLFAIIISNLCAHEVIIKRHFGFTQFDLLLFQCPIQPIESEVVTSTSIIVKTHYSFILIVTSGSQELCRFVVKRAPLLIYFTLVQRKQ